MIRRTGRRELSSSSIPDELRSRKAGRVTSRTTLSRTSPTKQDPNRSAINTPNGTPALFQCSALVGNDRFLLFATRDSAYPPFRNSQQRSLMNSKQFFLLRLDRMNSSGSVRSSGNHEEQCVCQAPSYEQADASLRLARKWQFADSEAKAVTVAPPAYTQTATCYSRRFANLPNVAVRNSCERQRGVANDNAFSTVNRC
jgi:hypothetical protein